MTFKTAVDYNYWMDSLRDDYALRVWKALYKNWLLFLVCKAGKIVFDNFNGQTVGGLTYSLYSISFWFIHSLVQ